MQTVAFLLFAKQLRYVQFIQTLWLNIHEHLDCGCVLSAYIQKDKQLHMSHHDPLI